MSEASIGRGVPPGSPAVPYDFDSWLRSLCQTSDAAEMRKEMYGADAARCARLNVFQSVNTEIPYTHDSASLAYMEIGNALEKVLMEALLRAGLLISSNYRMLKPKIAPVSGKIDLVFIDQEGDFAIGEVKSCGKLPVEPKFTHKMQATCYALMAGFDRCYLTYASRNVQEKWGEGLALKTFEIDTSPEALQAAAMTVAQGQVAINNGLVPPVPSWFRKSIECSFCQYKDYCWNEGESEQLGKLRFIRPDTKMEAAFLAKAEALAIQIMAERPSRLADNLLALSKDVASAPAFKRVQTEAATVMRNLGDSHAEIEYVARKKYEKTVEVEGAKP